MSRKKSRFLFKRRSLAAKKGWETRHRKARSLAAKKGWKTRRRKKLARVRKARKLKVAVKRQLKKFEVPEACPIEITPVSGVKNQYTVSNVEACTLEQQADLVFQQLKLGASIFRFWFKVPTSPDYPEGVMSTSLIDLPRSHVQTLVQVKRYLKKNILGFIYQWFYFVGRI